jgi:predicted acyltransferase
VDALRGLTVAAMLLVNNPGDWSHVAAPLAHAAWHGLTPADLVFPLFLFIAGVSLTLHLEPALQRGQAPAVLRSALLWRAARIVLLGLALHALAHVSMDTRAFRVLGVLQRIGLCVAAAGLLVLYTSARRQWIVFGALLLGYAAMLALGGTLDKEGNLAARIDTLVLGRFAYEFDAATGLAHEPEGLLSTLPAIATTLLGVRSGAWLRRGQHLRLWQAAAVCGALGTTWSLLLPLNKQLWTPPYVLVTGALALLALALAHQAIDRWGGPALGRSLGLNAIAVYAGAWAMTCLLALPALSALQAQGVAALARHTGAHAASLAFALAFTTLWWLVARVLQRLGWRLRF